MVRIISTLILVILIGFSFFNESNFVSYSQDSVDQLEQELQKAKSQKELKEKILTETQAEIHRILSGALTLSQKITAIEDKISTMEASILETTETISRLEGEILALEAVILEKESQVQETSRRLYLGTKVNLFDIFVSEDNGSSILRGYVLKKYALGKQREIIDSLSIELANLGVTRGDLETEKVRLEAEGEALVGSKEILASEQAKLQAEIVARNASKGRLANEISLLNNQISELQEAILVARSGAYVPSVGSLPTSGDYLSTAAGFRERAPANSFSVFSFGAYTHRKGMSQYGALARAIDGQSYTQILEAYYGKSPVLKDTSGQIKVAGNGSLEFDGYYLYGIAEMPSSWNLEALKAQAVAARTYAYRYYVQGTEICITESCQVFNRGKADATPQAWKDAVNQTRGMVLEDVVTFYSSTTGGYLTTSGWDTTDKTNDGDWVARAYESKAGSPWFYKSWYRAGYSDSSSSCGRNPWMSEEEMADILNTYLVMKRNGTVGTVNDSRILPVTVNSCPYGNSSGNPYSMAEMRALLGSPVTDIIGFPAVSISTAGQTTQVTFSTNRGVVSIPGADFKSTFNTRAPGYLAIPQSGFAMFNIESK